MSERAAVISDCGLYRYWLERGPAGTPYVAWVLANPSTADASIDDPTVRKARGFSKLWGYERFVFVNVFGYRSTDPMGLRGVEDPVGPLNENHIREVAEYADKIVVAWGNAIIKEKRPQIKPTLALLTGLHDKPLHCLGYTADRSPRHPLMLAYSTPLEEYKP
jgi:hypothetical protein